MADPLGNFVPEFIENEVEREAIVKLAKMITDRVPQKLGMKKITKYDPEYWGLSAVKPLPSAFSQCLSALPSDLMSLAYEHPFSVRSLPSHLYTLQIIPSMRNSMYFQCLYREVLSLEI